MCKKKHYWLRKRQSKRRRNEGKIEVEIEKLSEKSKQGVGLANKEISFVIEEFVHMHDQEFLKMCVLSRVVIGGETRRRLPFCLYPEIVVEEKRGDAESESARVIGFV